MLCSVMSQPIMTDLRVGDIASSAVSFDILTNGSEVARFFESTPDSPGVTVTREGKFFAALSQHDFLHTISRQYGLELFHRRPIEAVLGVLRYKPLLLLPSDCTIDEAVTRCLARAKNEIFDPFLVEKNGTGEIQMVDFRALIMASSNIFAFRNQQLAEEIQERKLLEKKLLCSQRMEVVGLLAGGIAHNLNNTLGPIMMAASMLHRDLPTDMHADFVRTIEDGVQRAADIIGQLLVFSRGQGGELLTFSPGSLLREVEKFVVMTFPKSITFRSDPGRDLCNITGDQTQLQQVLLNLCINARDAMPQGGTLTLSAANSAVVPAFGDMPSESAHERYLALSVTDTGCGIAPEIIDKIFDPFFTTKEVGKGTGLGLSTAIGIVRSHNGFIRAVSEVGKGTTFTLYLPATEAAIPDSHGPPALDIPTGQGEWILVVDDEAPICRIAERILQQNGYKVLTASNGDEALKIYEERRQEISLVLTDISMPAMDGIELARVLTLTEPNVKIIVSSGKIDQNHDSILSNLGVKGRLWKPYGADQLLRTTHAIIHGETPPAGAGRKRSAPSHARRVAA